MPTPLESASQALAKPASPALEGLHGLVCGVAFGLASPLASHPLDTIKCRMQVDPQFARGGALQALRATFREGGVRRLYAGLLPPLAGSVVYRSVQFAAYKSAFTALDSGWAAAPLPLCGGLEPRVLLATAAATTVRASVETPLEVWKVRRQLGVPPPGLGAAGLGRELFTGAALTWTRLYIALGTYFVLCDLA